MRPLQFLKRHPITALGALVLVFVVWIGLDLRKPNSESTEAAPFPVGTAFLTKRFPAPPEFEYAKPSPQGTAQVLPKLKPGMTRIEVEGLVGAPVSSDVHPAMVAGGRITYHTAYEADLEPLSTVRPIRHTKVIGPAPPRTLITLEFDATKPGHPLVEIHYPDPLF
ncbi:hypothetical protein VT84_39020 [Gemmata sp. SH-PL17]|uniref:hypothetical protein n=1 Tax=Gemmata sp. SH-PL17 TaxID=1630693 RepID=UPI0004B7BA1D|nr:hypothetical protein [Gemmata sp. SH-PL17]AMV30451.1 hypothetical protein VT84_39020 [Gemmata sp. SH-PL17]